VCSRGNPGDYFTGSIRFRIKTRAQLLLYPEMRTVDLSQVGPDPLQDRFFGHGPDQGVDRIPVYEKHHGRNAANIESSGCCGVLVHIQLHYLDFSGFVYSQSLQDRTGCAAGGAPFRPEVDQYGKRSCNLFLKTGVCSIDYPGQWIAALAAYGNLATV
jgi:hypothetical protein